MAAVLQRFAEWYLDLPAAGVGQGTTWRLDWGPSVGAEQAGSTLFWLVGIAAAVMGVVYIWETSALSWRPRAMLLVLRLAVAGLLLLVLGRVSVRVDRTELPTVAVLIDTSASMGLVDRYNDATLSRAVRQLIPEESRHTPTRLDLAKAILTRHDNAWWQSLLQSHRVRLFAFDQHLRSLEAIDDPTDAVPFETLAAVPGLSPQGSPTSPGTALRELFDEFRGTSLAAVILLTDGIASAGEEERVSRVASLARERGVPLYPIGIGSRDPNRDLELFDLLSADVVNLGEPLTLSFRHRSFGLAGQTTELQVTAEGEASPWVVQTLRAGADLQAESVEVSCLPPAEGIYDLTISAAPLDGETDVGNNVLRHHIEVRRDQLKVLLVEGRPRWEYRKLKPVFERDDTLQLDTFLQSADLDYTPEDRTALRSFPATQAQLDRYDVIVWGDLDLHGLDPGVSERLRSFVRDHGGGLLFIAGEEHNPLQYRGTALELLLPVSLLDAAPSLAESDANSPRFRLQRTLEGGAHSFLRLSDDPAEDEAIWQDLPREMEWFAQTPTTKPGASVLATGDTAGPAAAAPLIVLQRYGAGQVLYHGVDTLWTWRKRVEDRFYGRYWSQAVRSLAAGLRHRDESGRELTTDRKVYSPGDEVRLRLRGMLAGADSVGDAFSATIDSRAGERFHTLLERRPDNPGVWESIVRELPLGEFRAAVAFADSASDTACSFRVVVPDLEMRERALAITDLEQAARVSHGQYHSFAQADLVPDQIPQGRPVRLTESQPIGLWNRWESLLLLVSLLAAEWMLRQRVRLV